MRNILIDTNAYAAFKRGDEEAIAILRHAPHIAVSTVVLGELLSGFACGDRNAENRAELAEFLRSPRVAIYGATQETADHYATVFAALRKKGRPIPTNDLWIAATAFEHGLAVYTLDQHFEEVENLQVGRCLHDFLL